MSLQGKVAFITGVARGQGRAHAVRLAREGADIVGIDICEDIASMDYPNASAEDLAETVRLVEAEDRRIVARKADVRDFAAVKAAVDEGVAELGRLDIVIANAGIIRLGDEQDFLQEWDDIIATNLTGVFYTVRATVDHLKAHGDGGSIVITSSSAGLKGTGTDRTGGMAYTAAKRGLVGLTQVLANELAQYWIRVNTIHPTGVDTPMVNNKEFAGFFQEFPNAFDTTRNLLPIPWVEPVDIANAAVFLASDAARYITGVTLPVDAGFSTI